MTHGRRLWTGVQVRLLERPLSLKEQASSLWLVAMRPDRVDSTQPGALMELRRQYRA